MRKKFINSTIHLHIVIIRRSGIRVVGEGSWKEGEVGMFKSLKLENFRAKVKVFTEIETFRWSWKCCAETATWNVSMKLKSYCCWKWKSKMNFEKSRKLSLYMTRYFPLYLFNFEWPFKLQQSISNSSCTFQLRLEFSNFFLSIFILNFPN